MNYFSKIELENAIPTINSMIMRSEKVKIKFKEGTPQASLTRNRLKALYIALSIITNELKGDTSYFNHEDLEKALAPITSTIHKCEKVLEKTKDGSPQATLTRKMIEALHMSSILITRELNKRLK
jgi:hypothetical protein